MIPLFFQAFRINKKSTRGSQNHWYHRQKKNKIKRNKNEITLPFQFLFNFSFYKNSMVRVPWQTQNILKMFLIWFSLQFSLTCSILLQLVTIGFFFCFDCVWLQLSFRTETFSLNKYICRIEIEVLLYFLI